MFKCNVGDGVLGLLAVISPAIAASDLSKIYNRYKILTFVIAAVSVPAKGVTAATIRFPELAEN